ncbi:MAG: universal stress protein [Actinomycetota bacterium]|jgi:nucleotide-binding universal stress UspA family protein|nr:universal stress protein [Actinomycetota bacterium]
MTTEHSTELVVVGVDGSPASAMAMAWAARYAKAMGATVRAVLAWHYPAAAGPAPIGVAPAVVAGDIEQARREDLEKAIAATFGDPPSVKVEPKVVYGHPSQVLIDESRDADLLVVGSRGHGGFTGMLLGSVSTHCVTHAACPVTVVRTS